MTDGPTGRTDGTARPDPTDRSARPDPTGRSARPHPSDRTFDDPHGTIAVPAGTSFVVRLPVPATAGYLWEVDVPADAPITARSAELTAGGPALGAQGVQDLHFAAAAMGTVELRFRCVRPWQTPHQAVAERTLRVQIG